MKINLIAFGIARDILGNSMTPLTLTTGSTIADLKKMLVRDYPQFIELASFSIAVNEDYQKDDFVLSEADEIVVLPPVSGG